MVNGEEIKEAQKEVSEPKTIDKKPLVLETFTLSTLEKFFSVALKLPYVDE